VFKLHEICLADSQKKTLKLLPPDVRFLGENSPHSISAGAPPQTPLGSLQRSPDGPDLLAGFEGLTSKGGRGRKRGGVRGEGREEKGGERKPFW